MSVLAVSALAAGLLPLQSPGYARGSPRTSVRAATPLCAESGKGPSFWDKLLHGQSGRPASKPEPEEQVTRSLKPFFAQLDRDGNGTLEPAEFKRALMLIGLRNVDFEAAFNSLDQGATTQ